MKDLVSVTSHLSGHDVSQADGRDWGIPLNARPRAIVFQVATLLPSHSHSWSIELLVRPIVCL